MAFVVPQHLPRSTQNVGYGSTTSHAEPVLRKLAEATRESLTSTEAGKWVDELQRSVDETKTRVQQRIQRDLPAFERHLASAKRIKGGLEEITSAADDLTDRVQNPQSGLLPTLLTSLAAHSTLAQRTSDAKVLETAVAYIARCRDEFKTLSTLVEDGHLPAAVRKADEAQSLIRSAPRPLERSTLMGDLSRLARVLGDRVQEQLGDAYSRAIAVTTFPTGITVVVLPHITIRDSSGVVTLNELFTSLKPQSLQEHLAALRKDIMTRAIEPTLTKPSQLTISAHDSILTIDHTPTSATGSIASFQHAHNALAHTAELVTFIHDTLFPSLLSQNTFAAQLAGPLAQALITHVLRPAIPRSGSLKEVPGFLRVAAHASEVEDVLNKMGLRGSDVKEWAQGAPGHYERRRREDLVQQVRSVVLERDNVTVAVKRVITREESKRADGGEGEEDPWAFDESAPKPAPPSVPVIAAPTPRNLHQPASEATLRVVDQPPRLITPPSASPLELPEVDGWGFDDDEPVHTSEDEPDVEVDAGTSQSEGAGTGASASGSASGDTSHLGELLSAPHSDAEVVNAAQSGEESDPWDDDPWADQAEGGIEAGETKEQVPMSPSKSPAPTLSPTNPDPPSPPKPAPPLKVETLSAPAVVETPPSPAVHAPSPRVARGLERFAQKNRGSPSPTPSKFSSPVVSNASPTVSHISSSAFGTAPSSAFPQSATYGSPTTSYHSPPKPHAPLPNPGLYGSPTQSLASLPAAASLISNKPPTIAPPITPAMRRAQQQAKLASGFGGSDVGSASSSVVGSPPRNGRGHEQRDSVGSGIRLFGVGETQNGSQSVPGSPERRTTVLAPAKEGPMVETYLVSRRAQKVLGLAEDALREGKELVSTDIFPPDTSPPPGSLVLGAIPSFFDLFRALVPVAHGANMAASGGIAMRFSNDCTYLSEETARLISEIPEGVVGDAARPKFLEVQERLKALGESWFEDVLENEKLAIAKYFEPTEGFRDMQDQAHYQECRRAVTRCTQAVTKFSRDTKPVLPPKKYYLALGALVDDVLVRITEDILAMPDIPETESHRLHDICKIVHAFEGLFVLEGDTEASLADIRHLFDIGALVDFSERDLAHLIRALFSDSPKRQELIGRVLAGHPVQA
ncbi:hypothetical protein FRC10_007341 [Ceratobasidium sp. 414]|nr:hypothetical protein FRC10_007341 [Ceratobasidium sp. 414]